MENKYTRRLLEGFPNVFGFTQNPLDPLYIIADLGASLLDSLERTANRQIKNLFIDSCDPALPCAIYFIDLDVESMDNVRVTPEQNGGAQIVTSEPQFLDNRITGFDYVEELVPSGVFPAGILGVSYGFDWDGSSVYVSAPGSDHLFVYPDGKFADLPQALDYTTIYQSYGTTGLDEYLNFSTELAGDGIVPSGVLPTDLVKVAYLAHDAVGDITVTDVGNLKDPDNPEADGIVVCAADYAIDGNRIVFRPLRSDYQPAAWTNDVFVYPQNYQPDSDFSSVFIAEYSYRAKDCPRYLAQMGKLHNLGKKENPQASY